MPRFEDMSLPEHIPNEEVGVEQMPFQDSEIVQQFRRDIDYWFIRFQNFYDRANAALRSYRFGHVNLITMVYNRLMTVFGDDIEAIRQSSWELEGIIEARRAVLGQNNACLNGVQTRFTSNSVQVGLTIQACALYTNATMSNLLLNNFYPAFATIQNTISGVNVAVVDALSRGNVLQDEEAIIEYLRSGYSVIEFQWLSATSQLLRWETNRFNVDGLFLVDEMTICMAAPLIQFTNTNAQLEADAMNC